MKKILLIILAVLLGGFILMQLVPYGRTHSNPPVVSEPDWDSAETQALAERACFDCHSNETEWPWTSHIAPTSWLIQHDVEEGREHLNFSEWSIGGGEDGEEMAEVIYEGEMPLAIYLITHPEARLSEDEKQRLAQGLLVTGGEGSEREHEEEEEHEEDDD